MARIDGGNLTSINPADTRPMDLPTIGSLSLSLPDAMGYDEWLSLGRQLAIGRQRIDWIVGDWITYGREHYPEQIALALPGIVDDEKQLRRIEKTVRAFPPHLRHSGLSFEHHAHVADMPVQEALPLLVKADAEHLNAKRLRIEAMTRKLEIGQIMPRDEDAEDDALIALVRAWNRAPKSARDEFAEMVESARGGLIEFDTMREAA